MSLKVGKCDGVGHDTHVVLHLITSWPVLNTAVWCVKRKKWQKSSSYPLEKPERSEKAEKAEKPIKLVLKVGSSQEKVTAKPDPQSSSTSRPSLNPDKTKSKDHSSKKKKKKRSASRERKKPRFDPGSSVSTVHLLLIKLSHSVWDPSIGFCSCGEWVICCHLLRGVSCELVYQLSRVGRTIFHLLYWVVFWSVL